MAFAYTKLMQAMVAAGVVTDPYFNLVTLLLPGDGTNGAQNNTFLDSSSNNFTITRNGNTTQGTFSPFSQTGWSNYFNGSSYLNVGTTRFLDVSAWTVEMWVNTTSTTNAVTLAAQYVASGGGFAQRTVLGINNSSGTVYIFQGGTAQNGTTNVADGRWHHIAFVLNAGTVSAYVDGINEATFSGFGSPTAVTTTFFYDSANASSYFLGYASNLRVTNTAVYTANFTVATSPLTAITGTQLLTCQSNRFVDNSSNAYAITVNGSPSVQAFSPFAPTAAYSAATNGGSGYFDGSGDYLSVPSSADFGFGTGDFTIECWVYPLASTAQRVLFGGGDLNNIDIGFNPANTFQYYDGTVRDTGVSAASRQWFHVAVSRTSGTVSIYVNGVRTNNFSDTSNTSTRQYYVGGSNTGTNPFNGYISNARIIKGTGIYSGTTITVPTAPFTAISNTKLLLNFTNAGITDATAKNVLETVGNAQISTTQSKFGGSSLYFDGTGDWLTAPDSPNLQLGSGDFTIEGWAYLSATGVAYGLVSKGTSTTGWSVNVTSGNKLQFSYTSSNLTGATSLSSATWYYFAVVRSGTATGNLKLYLNGTADATSAGAVTDNFNQTNILYIGADRTGSSAFNGYIDDLRITKGYARTIATPSSAFALQ